MRRHFETARVLGGGLEAWLLVATAWGSKLFPAIQAARGGFGGEKDVIARHCTAQGWLRTVVADRDALTIRREGENDDGEKYFQEYVFADSGGPGACVATCAASDRSRDTMLRDLSRVAASMALRPCPPHLLAGAVVVWDPRGSRATAESMRGRLERAGVIVYVMPAAAADFFASDDDEIFEDFAGAATTRHPRSPLFLGGEGVGAVSALGVAARIDARAGRVVSGVVLVDGGWARDDDEGGDDGGFDGEAATAAGALRQRIRRGEISIPILVVQRNNESELDRAAVWIWAGAAAGAHTAAGGGGRRLEIEMFDPDTDDDADLDFFKSRKCKWRCW